MMGRVSCADLAELRSAFLDGALREPERDRVLSHLAGCQTCRTEVDELRQVRSLLTRRFAGPEPVDLSHRLLTIPTSAHKTRGAGHVPGLPGAWRGIRRRVLALVAALGLTAAVVGGLGLAAAPARALADVRDPGTEGAAEFSDASSQLPLSAPVGTVLSLLPTDDESAAPRARPSRQPQGAAYGPDALGTLLARVSRADQQTLFEGQQIYYAVRGDRRVSATLQILNQPDVGTRVVAYDRDGNQVGEHVRAAEVTSRITDTAAAALIATGYAVNAHPAAPVLERATVLLEATPRGVDPRSAPILARWWIDEATGLVLWQETYDSDGELLLATGFSELEIGSASVADSAVMAPTDPTSVGSRATASLTLSRAGDLASAGWACSTQLAGLSLVRLRSDGATDPGVVHMVYSDGVSTVSVIEQRGQLTAATGWEDDLHAYVQRGALTSASWQSGESVVTVVTDAPEDTLHAVVTALPHEALRSPSTMDRVVAGWSRILGHQ